MNTKIILREFNDWTQIDKKDEFWENIGLSRPDINFGIHEYNGELWTSGYVGVGRVFDKKLNSIETKGKEHVVMIKSQYGIDPWKMLEKVMTDSEYNSYCEEMIINKKNLFYIFYDQPLLKLEQDQNNESEILLALSFINACYSLCKKGIKKKMIYQEENYNAKIRGKIDIKKNIRFNTSHGRNDRFYCKYIDFTTDNIENRILKATLYKCKKIVEDKFELSNEIVQRVYYCLNSFRKVEKVRIKTKDFKRVSVSGLYIYYKPLLRQAKLILRQKYYTYKAKDGNIIRKSIYTIPYMINMETVFEFYVRTVFKDILKDTNLKIDSFSKKVFLEKSITKKVDTKKGIHLMPYCIPDILVRDSVSGEVIAVLDAKYKSHSRAIRQDSLQLLSYVLLTGSKRCGFVFPGEKTEIKKLRKEKNMFLNTPLISELKYYELILGNIYNIKEIEKIFS